MWWIVWTNTYLNLLGVLLKALRLYLEPISAQDGASGAILEIGVLILNKWRQIGDSACFCRRKINPLALDALDRLLALNEWALDVICARSWIAHIELVLRVCMLKAQPIAVPLHCPSLCDLRRQNVVSCAGIWCLI